MWTRGTGSDRPLIPGIGFDVLRYIQRVVTGGGDHAQNLAGFIVVYRYGACMAVQGLIGFIVVPGVNGEIQFPALCSAEGAIEEVIASQFVSKGIEGTVPIFPCKSPTAWRVALRTVALS